MTKAKQKRSKKKKIWNLLITYYKAMKQKFRDIKPKILIYQTYQIYHWKVILRKINKIKAKLSIKKI